MFNGKKSASDAPPVPIAMLGLDIYSLFTSADEVSFKLALLELALSKLALLHWLFCALLQRAEHCAKGSM
jgi:hypothetical protein